MNNQLQDFIIFLLNLQQEVKCCPTNLPTNSMEHSPSWEADSSSTNQEISLILLNPKLHYPVHKSPTFPPVSHINPVHACPTHLIHFNIIPQLCLGLPNVQFRQMQNCQFLSTCMMDNMH